MSWKPFPTPGQCCCATAGTSRSSSTRSAPRSSAATSSTHRARPMAGYAPTANAPATPADLPPHPRSVVQTFLPYADFDASAAVLDDRRLGKQRVETMQVLRALVFPSYRGWKNHPATRMWRGCPGGAFASRPPPGGEGGGRGGPGGAGGGAAGGRRGGGS